MFLEFLLVFIISLWLISIIKNNAHHWGLIDIPNVRSEHVEHTASGAGIGFYLAVALILPIFYFDLILSYRWTCVAILLIFSVGVLDDHHEMPPPISSFLL
jgi:UDP-N-acetylmuramyl pentapeptide phosphotransferase/UDP-N-acetylglucosamine-1-phosphate transferase